MRSVTTLILGILLAAMVGTAHAQDATGAAQQVRKSAEQAAAQASGNKAAAAKPPAQVPAKNAAPTQAKPAAATPGKSSPAAQQNKPPAQAAGGGKTGTPAPAPAAKQAAPQAGKSATPQSAKPAAPASKSAAANKPAAKAAKTAKKPSAKKPAVKRAAKSAPKSTSAAANAQAMLEGQRRVARRDPFEAMIGRENTGAAKGNLLLPQGKAGLQVSTLRLDGVVRAPNGMIAVVSNPQSRTYFLREGDQLYDGRVEKIAMDGVSFHEVGKDAFGKPVERQVNKRIYASAGEQQ